MNAEMNQEWYVQVEGESYGPYSGAKLLHLAKQERVVKDNLVKLGKDGEWMKAERVRYLFGARNLQPINRKTKQRSDDPEMLYVDRDDLRQLGGHVDENGLVYFQEWIDQRRHENIRDLKEALSYWWLIPIIGLGVGILVCLLAWLTF